MISVLPSPTRVPGKSVQTRAFQVVRLSGNSSGISTWPSASVWIAPDHFSKSAKSLRTRIGVAAGASPPAANASLDCTISIMGAEAGAASRPAVAMRSLGMPKLLLVLNGSTDSSSPKRPSERMPVTFERRRFPGECGREIPARRS